MEHSFWHQRWKENRIGFHLPETNALLEKYLHYLELQQMDKIFVPLCGKTLDMLYLKQQGYQVLGNELSSLAVNSFFNENNLPFTTELIQGNNNLADKKDLVSYRSEGIEIINGDFFALKKNSLAGVRAIYDRASMVALPEALRKKYVQFLLTLLKRKNGQFVDKIKLLLVTLEYDQELKQGPPFSVTEKEVFNCYQNDFSITLVDTQETPMKQRGEISKQLSMKENVYLLQPK
jgi:thiopurine S-methyltransferase